MLRQNKIDMQLRSGSLPCQNPRVW